MYDLDNLIRINAVDDEDFTKFMAEKGITEEHLWQSRIILGKPDLTTSEGDVYFDASPIHGKGVFAKHDFAQNEFIAPLYVNRKFTRTGLMVNHSKTPNAVAFRRSDRDIWIKSITSIPRDSEITINYREIR